MSNFKFESNFHSVSLLSIILSDNFCKKAVVHPNNASTPYTSPLLTSSEAPTDSPTDYKEIKSLYDDEKHDDSVFDDHADENDDDNEVDDDDDDDESSSFSSKEGFVRR